MKILSVLTIISVLLFYPFGIEAALNTTSADLENTTLSDYFSTADSAEISITDDLTLEAWVKVESFHDDGNAVIISKWDFAGNKRSYRGEMLADRGRIAISSDGANGTTKDVLTTFNTGTWYHVAWLYDASAGGFELCVNGTSIGTASALPTSIHDNTSELLLGAEGTSASPYSGDALDGMMDDLRIYNTLRTCAQVAGDYNTQLAGNETGLVAYWMLNNGAGTCATTQLEDKGESTDPVGADTNDITNNGSTACTTDVPFVGSVASVAIPNTPWWLIFFE